MNIKLSIAVFALLIPSVAAATKIDKGNLNVIHIKADSVIYQKDAESYYAKGSCTVYTDKYSLSSDKAYFNKKSSIVALENHVLFKNNSGDWIRGTQATFNTATYKGFVDNAVMFIKSAHLYIKAKKIIIDGKDRYYINTAMATGCKCDKYLIGSKKYHPKWSIITKHIYIVKDKYLIAYPATFKIRSMPLFFTPIIYRSLARKRKSGFLFPSIGHSSKDGFILKEPFYIAIDKSRDMTFTPFIYSISGVGLITEGRYYLTKESNGQWNIVFFKERKPYGNSKKNKFRITIDAQHTSNLKKYGIFKYDINWVSNKNNYRVLNKDDMTKSSKRYTKSALSYFIEHKEYSLGISGYYYQDLISDNNRKTLQKIPEFNFNIINKNIFKNIKLDIQSISSNNFRKEGLRGYSNDTYIALSYPVDIFHFSIIPKVGIYNSYAAWTNTYNSHSYSKNIFTPECSIALKTIINGFFFSGNTKGLLGIKHIVTPTLKYKYIAKRNFNNIPDFMSFYDKRNAIEMSLENRIIAKYTNNDNIEYREIFYNKLTQEYDFYKEKEKGTYFPAIYEETRLSPFKFLTISSKAHFSTKRHLFTDMDNNINIKFKDIGGSIGYLLKRDNQYKKTDENIMLNFHAYPTKKLYIYANVSINIHDHYEPKKTAGFLYKEDCWSIGIDLYQNQTPKENKNGQYSRRKDTGVWLTIAFKGLGKIKTQNKQWTNQ